MKREKFWINLSILNLSIVALLGVIMRSKIIFNLPIINYSHLLESHSHFAFGGWITLALMVLMVYELLPASLQERMVYQWIFGIIFITSWVMLFTYYFEANSLLSDFFSATFIFATYVFGWIFIKDVQKSGAGKTILLLVVSSIVSLVLSSLGPFTLDYLFTVKSQNAILYRDASFAYLHLQYNGFFTLAVFSLLFHKLEAKTTLKVRQNIYRFSVLLVISILPSLFLSFLWHDPTGLYRVVAGVGSFFVFLSLVWFLIVVASPSFIKASRYVKPIVRYIVFISMGAFMLKMFLQTFTIFPSIGNAVFGDRPMIIGFLHLVFLGFITLFILAYFAQMGLLNVKSRFTRLALIAFSLGVIFNEVLLMAQGLGAMFVKSSSIIPWLLWGISILLFTGALLIGVSRIKFSVLSRNKSRK